MPSLRTLLTPRHGTVALLGGGLIAGVIGVALGWRLQLPTLATAGLSSAAIGPNLSAPAVVSSDAEFESTWQNLAALPASSARDEAQSDALADLATCDPERAIASALAEPNALRRQLLLYAALRGWASVSPDSAANWSLQRPLGERGADIGAVLEAVANDPAAALRLTERLVHDDPALAHDHGCSLMYALGHRGDFGDAAAFATQGSVDHRESWLATAFSVWTEHQPQAAVAAALTLPDVADREAATQVVMTRWATLDPRSLAEFARNMPSVDTRRSALSSALAEWADQDLRAASTWLNQFEPSPDFDAGVAAVATRSPLVTYRPDTAVNWAESIFDPVLRVQTLTRIVNEWARFDRVAAQHYAETSGAVGASDRQSLFAGLPQTSEL